MTYTETLNYLDHMKRDLEVDLQRLKQYNQLWDYAEVCTNIRHLCESLTSFQDALLELRERKGDNASTTIQDNIR